MTQPIFGEIAAANDALDQQQRGIQRRADHAENSARFATNTFSYTTTGTGQMLLDQPVTFDCVFTEEPFVLSGLSLSTPPDPAHWQFPNVTVGVYRWVRELQKPSVVPDTTGTSGVGAQASPVDGGVSIPPVADTLSTQSDNGASVSPTRADDRPYFYTGAYLFFVVQVAPLKNVIHDGSNLAQLQAQLLQVDSSSPEAAQLRVLIAEAQEALYLQGNPAKVIAHHSIQFGGVAMKKLSDSITALASDKAVTPAQPPVTQQLATT